MKLEQVEYLLPEMARLIATLIGLPRTLSLIEAWGGTTFPVSKNKRRDGQIRYDALADWFGSFITRYRVAQVTTPRKRGIDRGALAARLPRATLERDPWSRYAWRRRGRDARLYVAGGSFDAPLAWARVLASGARVFDGARLARLPQRSRGVALLAALIDGGHLRLRQG